MIGSYSGFTKQYKLGKVSIVMGRRVQALPAPIRVSIPFPCSSIKGDAENEKQSCS
jgi:hypothetical protein